MNNSISEEQTIFDSIPAWIFYKDKENKFVRVNKVYCEAVGRSKTELEGTSLFEVYPKEIAEKYWEDDKEVMNSGVPKLKIVEQATTVSGIRWVQTDKIPYKNEAGEIIGIIGFSIDITEQMNAEIKNKQSYTMLQNIIDLLPVRIFWKDVSLHYQGCNLVFANDAGKKTTQEMIGKDDYDMGWKEQADLYRKDDQEIISSGNSKVNYEEEQTTPDGKKIWLNTNKVPLRDEKDSIMGVLGTYADITDKIEAKEKLQVLLQETTRMNETMVGRELKMIELKKRVEDLEKQISELQK